MRLLHSKKGLLILLFLLILLPIVVFAVLNRTNIFPRATILSIATVKINPGQIVTTPNGPAIHMSALAVDVNGVHVDGVRYQWGMSSTNSIGTIHQESNDKLATFTPTSNIGQGDIWVRAFDTSGQSVTGSIPVYVGVLPSPCTQLPQECQNSNWQECTALMGAPETGRWCPWPSPTCSPVPEQCRVTEYLQCVSNLGYDAPIGGWCPPPIPTPSSCNGQPDGSSCEISNCPVCTTQPCPLRPCFLQKGICKDNRCLPVTPSPVPSPGCRYVYPQCVQRTEGIQAPCNPILVCPTPISRSVLQVIYPNGGVTLYTGQSSVPIRWDFSPSYGASYAYPLKTSIYLINYNGGIRNFVHTIADNYANTYPSANTYTWSIPRIEPGNYRIYISIALPNSGIIAEDESDTEFTIKSENYCPTPLPCPVPYIVGDPGFGGCPRYYCPITPTPTFTPTPTSPPNISSIEFRIKFSGVTDGAAEGAGVTARFVRNDINVVTPPILFAHIGNGVYKATVGLTGSLTIPAGPGYTIVLKGEKHVARKFCKQTGQTGPCIGNESMIIPSGTLTPVFDFTGLPLDPGDLPPQDGKADTADFDSIKALLSKPCSALTTQEKKTGDLDYNGCVDIGDVFLMRKTLETRYDEN